MLFSESRMRGLLIFVLLLGVGLRCYWYIYDRSLWGDEIAIASNFLKYDLKYLLTSTLDNLQAAPPLYITLEKLVISIFGNKELSLRLVSFISSIASVFIFFFISAKIFNRRTTIVFANLLFSISTPLIYYSAEVKQYQTEMLASLIILWIGIKYRYFLSWKGACIIGVLGGILLWLSNPAIFVLAGIGFCMFFWLLKKKDYSSLVALLCVGTFWLFCFGLYYLLIISKNQNVSVLVSMWQDKFAPLPIYGSWYLRSLIYTFNDPLGLSIDYSLIPSLSIQWRYLLLFGYSAFILLILGGVVLFRTNKYILGLLVSPILLTLVASFLKQYPFHERFLVFLAPFFYLIIAKPLDTNEGFIKKSLSRFISVKFVKAMMIISILYLLVNIIVKLMNPELFGNSYKFSNKREAIEHIRIKSSPTSTIYISIKDNQTFTYYSQLAKYDKKAVTFFPPDLFRNKLEFERYFFDLISQSSNKQVCSYIMCVKNKYTYKESIQEQTVNESIARELMKYGKVREVYNGFDVVVYEFTYSNK
ncbi:glycosyltransferase family 39 protein [Xanthocytophaga agilis]|uniref:Glycosyltransferase family 39 protein n=1 Tax=Xanthocytophaga agilis TaxID=3048010 RepID=A0AAE3UEL4_9BACT|nr:glycosyltransferase family 39 protein [Xanthocytophaga agilis]MDJ1502903.1 glycosyltransferase family 39 protein [Xanthocytophaga agilis]